ncbi:hypothetical protein BpHYR1_033119 [Brachionus plicatilis]|uniref:Uncharacterized protein n=1 Tax=Brachionus plicatilis TaxID=10195 RepID=A0A3M7PN87_BRAPC|nr:hypothetical protein BpHYR1_033119 [Brachionus plicatilis]
MKKKQQINLIPNMIQILTLIMKKLENNVDRTSKNGTIRIRLKDGEEIKTVGQTRHATRQINETKLSAFL